MKKGSQDPVHAWLVMMKAMEALRRYAYLDIEREGLGDSDFRVLEVLLHKGPMPVNAIGPKVNLNPGSISVAVDRLYKKGLVSRVESTCDRRVRTVELTVCGREMFTPLFRRHAAHMRRIFGDLCPTELKKFEATLKSIGKRAADLSERQAR